MLPDCVDADTGEAPAFMFYALSLRGTKPECKDRPDRAVAASSFVAKGRGRSALAGKGARGPSLGPRLRSAPARPLGLLPPPLDSSVERGTHRPSSASSAGGDADIGYGVNVAPSQWGGLGEPWSLPRGRGKGKGKGNKGW